MKLQALMLPAMAALMLGSAAQAAPETTGDAPPCKHCQHEAMMKHRQDMKATHMEKMQAMHGSAATVAKADSDGERIKALQSHIELMDQEMGERMTRMQARMEKMQAKQAAADDEEDEDDAGGPPDIRIHAGPDPEMMKMDLAKMKQMHATAADLKSAKKDSKRVALMQRYFEQTDALHSQRMAHMQAQREKVKAQVDAANTQNDSGAKVRARMGDPQMMQQQMQGAEAMHGTIAELGKAKKDSQRLQLMQHYVGQMDQQMSMRMAHMQKKHEMRMQRRERMGSAAGADAPKTK